MNSTDEEMCNWTENEDAPLKMGHPDQQWMNEQNDDADYIYQIVNTYQI